jgi:hypothetical protein
MMARTPLFNGDQLIRHTKTGGIYQILFTPAECLIETNCVPAYIYRLVDSPTAPVWVRPRDEMEDGRFVLVDEEEPLPISREPEGRTAAQPKRLHHDPPSHFHES